MMPIVNTIKVANGVGIKAPKMTTIIPKMNRSFIVDAPFHILLRVLDNTLRTLG